MKITKIGQNGISLIKHFEGFYPAVYRDSVGIPTIGIGTIRYPGGRKVTLNDPPITEQEAIDFLISELNDIELKIDAFTTDEVNQNQFDALCSFAYNLGTGSLRNSTLLKKVNFNVNDPSIRDEFLKWVYAGGEKLEGLEARRKAEADLYFSTRDFTYQTF